MMMFSPGASVRVYLPNLSMVQSYPCGTVLMPANSVKITSSTSAMAKISNPVMKIPLPSQTSLKRNAPSCKHCHALQCGESPPLVAERDCKVRGDEKRGNAGAYIQP